MFNTNVDNKINNTNVDKKINNTNDEDFTGNIKDLFNNKLDKKINNNNTNDEFIENIRDLFSILDYEPVFDNNYLEYMSNGNNSLSFNQYLELIKPYLYDLINVYNYQAKFLLFRKNLDLMKCIQCILEVHLKKLLLVVKQKKLLKILLCQYYKNIEIIYRIK